MGPVSMRGDKARFDELSEIVCDVHFHCDMDEEKTHDYITYRVWLLRRNRLRTGKTA
jgi:hypothetical protein